MANYFKHSWQLAKQSIAVIKSDKRLLLFPLMSSLTMMLLLATIILPLLSSPQFIERLENQQAHQSPIPYLLLFVYYLVAYLIINFFNTALAASTISFLKGNRPSLKEGFSIAINRLPVILAWVLLSATVGVILHVIESRSKRIGTLVASLLLGASWAMASFFVIPILAVENVGPWDAMKRSTHIIRKMWGKTAISAISIWFILFVAMLLSLIPAFIGISSGDLRATVAGIIISAILLSVISLINATLKLVLRSAIYLYATDGKISAHFDENLIQQTFKSKK